MVAQSLRMPVVGRSIAGTVALTMPGPLCRVIGLTSDPTTARRIGRLLALSDYGGVVHVVASPTAERKKKAALTNAAVDALLAVGLLVLARRRRGSQRLAAIGASLSLWFGAGAWLKGVREIDAAS